MYYDRMRHTLSNIDKEQSKGDCAVCGRVNLYYREKRNYYICRVAFKKQKGYKIDLEREALLAAQGENCLICKDRMNPAHYDHDHVTGKFRGYLCLNCNVGLGMFKDNPERLLAAIEYLSR